MANKEHPIPDGMKILTNEDLEKVDALETFEELRDREQHFKLHYSKDNEAMQEWSRKKRVVRNIFQKNYKIEETGCGGQAVVVFQIQVETEAKVPGSKLEAIL